MKEKNDINNFLSNYSKDVIDNALKVREIVLKNLPSVIEQLDLSARMIAYCYGSRYIDMVCTLIPSKKGLKLGFFKGYDLNDPLHLLKGNGKLSRYIEINTKAELDETVLSDLLKQAFKAYNRRMNKE